MQSHTPACVLLCAVRCLKASVFVCVIPSCQGFLCLRASLGPGSRCNFPCTKTPNKCRQGREEHITGSSGSAPPDYRELQARLTCDQAQPLCLDLCLCLGSLRGVGAALVCIFHGVKPLLGYRSALGAAGQ